jgi:hypothetical protein
MKVITCCGTVRSNQKETPSDFGRKLRLKQCDLKARVKGDLIAVAWKDKQNVNMLTNMYHSSAESNVCD